MSLVLCFCGYMVKCIKIMVKEFYRLFSEIGGSDIHDKYTFLPQVVFAEMIPKNITMMLREADRMIEAA